MPACCQAFIASLGPHVDKDHFPARYERSSFAPALARHGLPVYIPGRASMGECRKQRISLPFFLSVPDLLHPAQTCLPVSRSTKSTAASQMATRMPILVSPVTATLQTVRVSLDVPFTIYSHVRLVEHLKDVPVLDLFSLRNQGVIVTGGARGLGLCLATSFLQAGASSVTCIDILPQPDSEDWQLAESTAKASSSQLRYRQLDITNEDAVASTFSSIFEESSVPVTGLCAAAGIQQMIPSLEYPAKDFRRIMEVNVTGASTMPREICQIPYRNIRFLSTGTFLTCQAAAREFKKRDVKGSIAVIASMSGSIANKGAFPSLHSCCRR